MLQGYFLNWALSHPNSYTVAGVVSIDLILVKKGYECSLLHSVFLTVAGFHLCMFSCNTVDLVHNNITGSDIDINTSELLACF